MNIPIDPQPGNPNHDGVTAQFQRDPVRRWSAWAVEQLAALDVEAQAPAPVEPEPQPGLTWDERIAQMLDEAAP